MVSDVDILFSPRYVFDAVALLRASPSSVVCAPMIDLPEESAEVPSAVGPRRRNPELETWKQWSTVRRVHGADYRKSICITYAALFRAIRDSTGTSRNGAARMTT